MFGFRSPVIDTYLSPRLTEFREKDKEKTKKEKKEYIIYNCKVTMKEFCIKEKIYISKHKNNKH